jgi:hypothetical protein
LTKARSNSAKTTIDTTTAVEAATKIRKIALTGALATGMPHIHAYDSTFLALRSEVNRSVRGALVPTLPNALVPSALIA